MLSNPRFNGRYFCHLLACFVFVLASGCGGGGGGSTTGNPANPGVTADNNSGGGISTGDGGIGSSSGGDSGADGTAGDGAPIVGGVVTITDANGQSVTATTNLQGYYSVNISGFKSPLIGNVIKGSRTLYTFSTKVAAANKTVTINITGITDKIVSDIAGLAGKDSARKITAADIVANANNIAGVIAAVNSSIASILTANGLNPATFDPINTPFTTNHKGYDAVLDALLITNGPTAPTRITPLTPLEATQQLFKSLRDTAGAYSNTANTGELDTAGNKFQTAIDNSTVFADVDTLAILAQFANGAKLYDEYKSGTSTLVFKSTNPAVFGRILTKSTSGMTVTNSLLPEYGCELAKVTTTTTTNGDLDISNHQYAGVHATSASASTTLATPAQVNAFSCAGIGIAGNMVGTALDDGNRRNNYLTFIPQPDGSYKYVDQTVKGAFDRTGVYPDPATGFISVREGAAKFGKVTVNKRSNGNYDAFTVTGQLTPGIKMLKLRTVAERAKFAHNDVNLNFNTVLSTAFETANLTGSIKLINADGSEASSMTIKPGSTITNKTNLIKSDNNFSRSYVYNQSLCPVGPGRSQFGTIPNITCVTDIYTTVTSTVARLSGANLEVAVSMPNAKFEGTVIAGSATFDMTGFYSSYQPTDAIFNGKFYESDGIGGYRLFLDGKVEVINTNYTAISSFYTNSSNYPKRNINFDGKLYLKDRPTMSLVLSYKNDSFTTNSMTGNFTWDGGWYFDIVANNNTIFNTGSITFTSVSGVTFTLPKNTGAVARPIYKSGALMGNITLNTKRINYADGTFEQF